MLPIKTTPGALNFYRRGLNQNDRVQPLQTGGQVELGHQLMEALHTAISRVFYVDLLRMPTDMQDPGSDGKGSTATYWLQRREKEMMALSPMLSRLQSEDLGPLIDRTFAIRWRLSVARKFGNGSPFPPPPPELSGAKLRPEYLSPIAMAQKASQLDVVRQMMQIQAQLLQMNPKARPSLDEDGIMRLAANDLNAPAQIMKTPEQMQAEAQADADAEQAMSQHMALANVAGAAKDGSAAVKNLSQAQQAA
jgi:hypothetical protein